MIRKNLKNKGFINSKGFIMFDPVYRNVMREKDKKRKKKISEEEIKNNVMSSINGIDVPSNIKDKEIDAKRLAKLKNMPTPIKLPINKDLMLLQSDKKKKKKKKRNKGSSIGEGGSSEHSDYGNTVSGEENM